MQEECPSEIPNAVPHSKVVIHLPNSSSSMKKNDNRPRKTWKRQRCQEKTGDRSKQTEENRKQPGDVPRRNAGNRPGKDQTRSGSRRENIENRPRNGLKRAGNRPGKDREHGP